MLENYTKVGVIYNNPVSKSTIIEVKENDSQEHYAVKFVGPLDDTLKSIIFNREVNALKNLNKYDNITHCASFYIINSCDIKMRKISLSKIQ